MGWVRRAVSLLLLGGAGLVSGCMTDRAYRVRGRVLVEQEGLSTPVAGATVAVRERGEREPQRRTAVTGAEGTYEVVWGYGGLWPFLPFGRPALTVEADGYLPVEQPVCAREGAPGVTRADCDPRQQCCARFIVVLTPAAAAAPPAD